MSELALLGGPRAITGDHKDMFTWPIITAEHEEAVLEVLRRGGMSGIDVTGQFEQEFAAWAGTRRGLGFSSGTASLQAAMFGVGMGVGDELIAPSLTYWASALQTFTLGATVVFADVDPDTLCIDPADIEHRITDRTKAIMVVHYLGHPADMDPIMEIARRRGIAVIEDVSHSQGGRYHGRTLGTIGDVGAMSLMSGKAFAIGEAGILITDDEKIYQRALAWGHYERFDERVDDPGIAPFRGLPLGGYKYRMHQLSSAVGRVQLRHYDEQIAEIERAMSRFWDQLDGVPGLRAIRPDASAGDRNGGWYAPHGLYVADELNGLSVTRFCEAVRAEGFGAAPGVNKPLHLHPLLNEADVYHAGKPTRIANSDRDLRQPPGSLPVSEAAGSRTYSIPWFKHYEPAVIDEYAAAYAKVSANHKELLADDPGDPADLGGLHFYNAG